MWECGSKIGTPRKLYEGSFKTLYIYICIYCVNTIDFAGFKPISFIFVLSVSCGRHSKWKVSH